MRRTLHHSVILLSFYPQILNITFEYNSNEISLKYKLDKKEAFRIKKGILFTDDIEIPFDFGLVFETYGIYSIEAYINESYNLSDSVNNKPNKYWDMYFTAKCYTDQDDQLEIRGLGFTEISPPIFKVCLTCYDCLIHVKKNESKFDKEISPDENPKLHYIEIEGLKMEFCDITEQIRARRGVEIKDFNNFERDHTSTLLIHKRFPYNQIFYQSSTNDNIIVEFPNETNNTLRLETYIEFKLDYISVLSLLNGAEVRIRREYTGDYYSVGEVDSHKVITYSFPYIENERFNRYVPLNSPFLRSDNILRTFFIANFDKYIEWNEKIDLNSIIFYLTNSMQAKSMEEKFFVQMIAYERLTTLYAEYSGEKEEFIPNKEEFEPIKQALLEVLKTHKEKFGITYNVAKSKLSNINQFKRLSTTDKMYRILNDVRIPISKDIELLIDQVRHKTIHRGEIGIGKQGEISFFLLDELLQEIILRLVEYKGKRESKILFSNNI